MADSFNKKDREKKRRKKRQDKAEKKAQRKIDGVKPPELMYVDADGNLTETPPDPTVKKEEIELESIVISTSKKTESEEDKVKNGVVKFFNSDRGYGFINDVDTGESYIVHVEHLSEEIKERDKVSFEVAKGPKGPIATKVIKK